MPIVDIVNVVAVRDGHVATAWTVLVIVILVSHLLLGLALHPLTIKLAVDVAIVDIVRVILVRNGDVTAPRTVLVLVVCVNFVLGQCHGCSPCIYRALQLAPPTPLMTINSPLLIVNKGLFILFNQLRAG